MDPEFSTFQPGKAFSSTVTDSDLLNFYTSNFDELSPILDNLEFSVNTNNAQITKDDDSPAFPNNQRDPYGTVPGLESDGTPGSSISSMSPESPLTTPLLAPGHSYEHSPSEMNLPEKRKASVTSIPAQVNNKKKQAAPKANPKRPGRRINPNEPESKRKAQNRAAQRAFRERKEQHLKDLEQRVEELENEAEATTTENEFLRKQVERLQTELRKFRAGKYPTPNGQSVTPAFPDAKFTFEFPFFQGSNGPEKQQQPTPPKLHDKSPAASVSSFENATVLSQLTPESSSCETEPKEDSFCEQLNLACGNRENPIPKYKATNALAMSTPDISGSPFANGSLPGTTPPATTIPTNKVISPPSFELDFLSDYKEPVFDADLLSSFADPTKMINAFDSLPPIHSNTTIEPSLSLKEPQFDSDDEGEDEDNEVPAPSKLMTCTAVWDRISSHPKFADLDIDGLCAELRTKAKCSESGVVLTESDVNKVLSSLN